MDHWAENWLLLKAPLELLLARTSLQLREEPSGLAIHLLTQLFIQHIPVECLLHAKPLAGDWVHNGEQNRQNTGAVGFTV